MFTLVYVSSASVSFNRAQLAELLTKARANNQALGITGMLLYKGGNFMQVLEGEESPVQSLRKKIAGDSRHHGMLILMQQHQPHRDFAEWSMAFHDLDSPPAQPLEGHSNFLNTNFSDPSFLKDASRIRSLLLSFRKAMR